MTLKKVGIPNCHFTPPLPWISSYLMFLFATIVTHRGSHKNVVTKPFYEVDFMMPWNLLFSLPVKFAFINIGIIRVQFLVILPIHTVVEITMTVCFSFYHNLSKSPTNVTKEKNSGQLKLTISPSLMAIIMDETESKVMQSSFTC